MTYTTLISAAELSGLLADPTCVVVDCRFDLADVAWGRREYEVAHIPGAVHAHLDADLSGAKTGSNGRHPLPDPDALRRTLGKLGISNDVQVVAYDQDNGMYASRLWWLLRWLGHDAVAVLDGGWSKWIGDGRPITSAVEQRAERVFVGTPRAELTVSAHNVAAVGADPAWRLLDARAPERFRGDVEPLDRVAGHVPGATNRFFKLNLTADGTFRPASELHREFTAMLGDVPPDHAVCYCGSGVTACHNLLALEHAGIPGARLYPGSWSEWSSDPARAVARGD